MMTHLQDNLDDFDHDENSHEQIKIIQFRHSTSSPNDSINIEHTCIYLCNFFQTTSLSFP